MAREYLVVPASEAQDAREALGRLYAESLSLPWPIRAQNAEPEDHSGDTLYYCNPAPSVDETEAAFGPRDEVLEYCAGKMISLTSGSYTVPSTFTTLPDNWFLNPPLPEEEEYPSLPPE